MYNNLFSPKLIHQHPLNNGFSISIYNSLERLKSLNMTPNILLSHSIIIYILSIFALHNKYKYITIILSLLSYYYLLCNKIFARKYNISNIFDNYNDIIILLYSCIYCVILIYKYQLLRSSNFIIGIIIHLILMIGYYSCIAKIYNINSNQIYKLLQKILFIKKEYIKFFRFFSPIQLLLYIYMIIVFS